MKKQTVVQEFERLEAFESLYESLLAQAHDKGLEEITDEVVIGEIKYQYETGGESTGICGKCLR